MAREVIDMEGEPSILLSQHNTWFLKYLLLYLQIHIALTLHQRSLILQHVETISKIYNLTKCKGQVTMEYPSLTELSAMQPPNLRPRESQGRVRREITQPRIPVGRLHPLDTTGKLHPWATPFSISVVTGTGDKLLRICLLQAWLWLIPFRLSFTYVLNWPLGIGWLCGCSSLEKKKYMYVHTSMYACI